MDICKHHMQILCGAWWTLIHILRKCSARVQSRLYACKFERTYHLTGTRRDCLCLLPWHLRGTRVLRFVLIFHFEVSAFQYRAVFWMDLNHFWIVVSNERVPFDIAVPYPCWYFEIQRHFHYCGIFGGVPEVLQFVPTEVDNTLEEFSAIDIVSWIWLVFGHLGFDRGREKAMNWFPSF